MSRVSKKATTKDVHDALSSYKILGSKHKLKNDFSIAFRGGNVFIRTKTRGAAYTALSRFNKISKTESIKIDGRPLKVSSEGLKLLTRENSAVAACWPSWIRQAQILHFFYLKKYN